MRKSAVSKRLDSIQTKAINKIKLSLKKQKKALVVMATGLGKTETAIKVIKSDSKRHLWVVGRNSLIEQTFHRFIGNRLFDVGILNGGSKDLDNRIIIASVQTLSKDNILKKFSSKDFDTVWVDEAHHAAADGYLKVLNHFKRSKFIGLTATPDRPDGENIYELFGKPAFEKTFEDAQKMKVLAKHEPMTILTQSVIEGLATKSGDYSPKSLDRLHTSLQRNDTIVRSYLKYGRAKVLKSGMKPKVICFCINVSHAQRLSAEFNKRGVKSEFVCARHKIQSADDRSRIETTFRNSNNIEVLCAVDLMNEGIDIPDVNVVLMARPTRSAIIYQQQIGRAARIDNGRKKFFVVLDYVDNCRREYGSYTIGNLNPSRGQNIPIIVEYLNESDPEVVKLRVEAYREGVNSFIKSARENYDIMKITDKQFEDHFLRDVPLPRAA